MNSSVFRAGFEQNEFLLKGTRHHMSESNSHSSGHEAGCFEIIISMDVIKEFRLVISWDNL